MLARSPRLRPAASGPRAPKGEPPTGAAGEVTPAGFGQGLLAMPFDALRFQYAGVVMAGLAQRSLLASGQSERALDALEKLVLGPLARQR
jgi:hypothetical protein